MFEFRGKSVVVRALFSIPLILITHFKFEAANQCELEKYRCMYALKLTAKECFCSEVEMVKNVQVSLFNQLLSAISKLHDGFKQIKSSVIEQLTKEMQFLSSREDTMFEATNFILLFSALNHGYNEENANPTVVTPAFKLFKKESLILAEYLGLIRAIKSFCQHRY